MKIAILGTGMVGDDVSTARGTEAYLALWLRLMCPAGGANFNNRLVR